MAALVTQNMTDVGFYPTFADATVSDTAEIGSGLNTFLIVKNVDDTDPHTATVVVHGKTFFNVDNPDNAVTVAKETEKWIPLRKAYGDATGRATITLPAPSVGDVKYAVVRLG